MVVLGVGGKVIDIWGELLCYNKELILNFWFLVFGGDFYFWYELIFEEGE